MFDVAEFIESLGGLHDAKLSSLVWHPADRRFEIGIDDIWSNFVGLPEYKGLQKAIFVFSAVSKLEVSVGDFNVVGLMIYDWSSRPDDISIATQICFSPGGKITVVSAALECVRV